MNTYEGLSDNGRNYPKLHKHKLSYSNISNLTFILLKKQHESLLEMILFYFLYKSYDKSLLWNLNKDTSYSTTKERYRSK